MPSLLIVDDEPLTRSFVRLAMTRRGWSVKEAASVPEALRVLEQTPVDVVLSDVVMPRVSGFALARALPPDLPFVFMSGHPLAPLSGDGLPREDAYPLLEKPFTIADLEGALMEALMPAPLADQGSGKLPPAMRAFSQAIH